MKLNPTDPDIETIVNRIEKGRLNLQPDFQRGEVWNTNKKKRLIDSILRGWHIPPVHIVDTASGRLEVLDGQQRLAAIRDFVLNKFKIDGEIAPSDEKIRELNGMSYKDLPDDIRDDFDSFPIRVFTITEYLPSEPSELFHRLNQLTNLTPAEQRNAYYGKAREQVKKIVETLSTVADIDKRIGFSNSRMNYDEVIARFLVYIENNTLTVKVTSNELTNYYRSEDGFSNRTIRFADETINVLIDLLKVTSENFKFNKATLLSWLLFIFRSLLNNYSFVNDLADLEKIIIQFETNRKADFSFSQSLPNLFDDTNSVINMKDLFNIYNDRSASRVADVSSVQLRDYILFIFAYSQNEEYFEKIYTFNNTISQLAESSKDNTLEELLIEIINDSDWSEFR